MSEHPYFYVKEMTKKLGLNLNEYFISCQGAHIHKPPSIKPYKNFALQKNDYIKIFNFANRFNIDIYALTEKFIHSHFSIISQGAITESYKSQKSIHSFPISELSKNSDISKICLFGCKNTLDSLKRRIPEKFLDEYNITRNGNECIDITSRKSSKEHALKVITQKLKLEQHEIIIIRDIVNDMI